MNKKIQSQVLKDVYKKIFIIQPFDDKADNFKTIRESANKIYDTSYFGFLTLENALREAISRTIELMEEENNHLHSTIHCNLCQSMSRSRLEEQKAEFRKMIDKVIEDKRKIANKNLTIVKDLDGKHTTLFVYLGLLRDSIFAKLGDNHSPQIRDKIKVAPYSVPLSQNGAKDTPEESIDSDRKINSSGTCKKCGFKESFHPHKNIFIRQEGNKTITSTCKKFQEAKENE